MNASSLKHAEQNSASFPYMLYSHRLPLQCHSVSCDSFILYTSIYVYSYFSLFPSLFYVAASYILRLLLLCFK